VVKLGGPKPKHSRRSRTQRRLNSVTPFGAQRGGGRRIEGQLPHSLSGLAPSKHTVQRVHATAELVISLFNYALICIFDLIKMDSDG
jgi:hypothetical protein